MGIAIAGVAVKAPPHSATAITRTDRKLLIT